ncbi:unnamed protein product [Acidithrix sp. C25]|nr:unnamed protein product [Acidithrix sp. C25]
MRNKIDAVHKIDLLWQIAYNFKGLQTLQALARCPLENFVTFIKRHKHNGQIA